MGSTSPEAPALACLSSSLARCVLKTQLCCLSRQKKQDNWLALKLEAPSEKRFMCQNTSWAFTCPCRWGDPNLQHIYNSQKENRWRQKRRHFTILYTASRPNTVEFFCRELATAVDTVRRRNGTKSRSGGFSETELLGKEAACCAGKWSLAF